jgi:aspartate-semialdehyde dehydrogenase
MIKKNIDTKNFKVLREKSIKSLIPPKIETENSSTKELEKFRKELHTILQNKESTTAKISTCNSNIPLVNLNF